MENLEFLYSLLSPHLFQEAKNNIDHLEYYFNTNPNTSGNPLVAEILGAIKNYDYNAIGEPLFKSILVKTGKTPAESQVILGEINKWVNYPSSQMDASRRILMDTIAKVEIDQILARYRNSPSDAYMAIKNSNLNTSCNECFGSLNFNAINIQKVLSEKSLGAIKTNYTWLNDAFPPHNGIERGQLGIICAPPGVGKSLFAMNLALYFASQGVKVLYVTLGDLVERDWIVRLGAIYSGSSFADAYNNMEVVYYNLQKITKGNLELSINPSGKVTSSEVVDYAMSRDFEVIFVDYDANHKGASDGTEGTGTSMYSSLGQIYSDYTRLSMAGRLVFMCSQPKIAAWYNLIGLADIGESKRKQETADFIITISQTAPNCPNHVYTAYIPKARRGKVGTKKYLIRIGARFVEIPYGVYSVLSQETEEHDYTFQDIRRMVSAYNKQMGTVVQAQQQVQQNSTFGGNNRLVPNPFANP